MKKVIAGTMILLLVLTPAILSVSALTNLSFGGKSGDWIEYDFQEALGVSTGEMVRMEYLNVSGTNVTVDMTIYNSDSNWVEWTNTTTFDLATQNDVTMEFLSARVYFIPGGLSPGDFVYLGTILGMRNITGETSKVYAGVSRSVIYANFTEEGSIYTLYWDEQTGVLTEGWMTFGAASEGVTFSATNMWGIGLALLLWIGVIGAIALGVLSSRKSIVKKLHTKTDAHHTSLKSHSFPSTP